MNAPTWNLETLFEGGITGEAFTSLLTRIEAEVSTLVERADKLGPPGPEWIDVLLDLEDLSVQAHQLSTFAHCCSCADACDRAAAFANGRVDALFVRIDRSIVPLEAQLASCSAEVFQALVALPELEEIVPRLERYRAKAPLLLPRAEQALATELGENGIHGWGGFYDELSGTLQVTLSDGRVIGSAQAQNLLGSADRRERADGLRALDSAWEGVSSQCARALTHIIGTRQTLNDWRRVDELADTCYGQRLNRGTLEALIEASRRAQPLLLRYLEARAGVLGLDKCGWEDLGAPIGNGSSWDWARARAFILEHFHTWSPELSEFAEVAFRQHWIEAEDRNHKRPGGWCARVPVSGESRIFMTHGGTFRSTTTLAHELGHAYHNHVTRDLNPSRRMIPSTLAETASVFAESIVRDAALEAAPEAEKLAMLDARLSAGVSFLMNLPARFDFERELYVLRRKGGLEPEVLSERMVAIQKRWYGDALSSWYPHFWASKLHFYISHFAFYNYPYTFGYLFAQLVYRRLRDSGDRAAYVDLLRRTGWQQCETLAQETLGLDLSDPDTWWQAIAPLEQDLEAFLARS